MVEFQKNESAQVPLAKPTLKDLLLAESPRTDITLPKRGGTRRREANGFKVRTLDTFDRRPE
jgi:hypothetical protein